MLNITDGISFLDCDCFSWDFPLNVIQQLFFSKYENNKNLMYLKMNLL